MSSSRWLGINAHAFRRSRWMPARLSASSHVIAVSVLPVWFPSWSWLTSLKITLPVMSSASLLSCGRVYRARECESGQNPSTSFPNGPYELMIRVCFLVLANAFIKCFIVNKYVFVSDCEKSQPCSRRIRQKSLEFLYPSLFFFCHVIDHINPVLV